jgi:hypothetical protein
MFVRNPLVAWPILVLFCWGCSAPAEPVRADDPLTEETDWYKRLDDLPRHYEGTFQWRGRSQEQLVEIWFEYVSVADDGGAWLARGTGEYRASRVTQIDVKARIDFETHAFEMWESNPDSEGFVTNGSHVGQMSSDFQEIEATWRGDDGNQGTLRLRVAESD